MSLYFSKKDRDSPLLHITKGTQSIATMKGGPISSSVLHTDRGYQVLEYVKSVSMVIETLGSWHGYHKYGVYNLGINILESSDMYVGVGRDLYTNAPILYTQNTSVFTYSGYWAWDYDQETQRGGYGFAGLYHQVPWAPPWLNTFNGVCKYAFALGAKWPGAWTYIAPNFTPSLDLYRIKALDLSATSSITVNSDGFFFDSINILKSNLIGVGPLMNDYAVSASISSTTSLFQLLNHSSDSISLERDKIYVTRGGTKVELVGTPTSHLISSNNLYVAPSEGSSFNFTIPTDGFIQLRYLILVGAIRDPQYNVSMITTIDAGTPSKKLRRFGVLVSDENASSEAVDLWFTKNGNGTGTLRLAMAPGTHGQDSILYGWCKISSLRTNTLSVGY